MALIPSTATRVVVTGASGFTGGAVSSHLGAAGFEVVRVARRPAPNAVRVDDYSEAPAGDVLVHLAEDSDRVRVNTMGQPYADASLRTVRNLLTKGYRTVIYASSATLYGDADPAPLQTSAPVARSDTYNRAKLACERAVLESGCGDVLRLSNLYGPGMAPNNVLSDILAQIPGSGPLSVRDDTPVRDFLWIDDMALLVARLARLPPQGLLNVGSGRGTSVRELAMLILRLAGEPERPLLVKSASLRLSVNVLDVSATERACGWRPSTALRDGLAALLRHRAPLNSMPS